MLSAEKKSIWPSLHKQTMQFLIGLGYSVKRSWIKQLVSGESWKD